MHPALGCAAHFFLTCMDEVKKQHLAFVSAAAHLHESRCRTQAKGELHHSAAVTAVRRDHFLHQLQKENCCWEVESVSGT